MLNPTIIMEQLHVPVDYKEVSASTQIQAKDDAKTNQSELKLYIADHQTAAIGRFERLFHAKSQEGIYMSLVIPGKFKEQDISSFTMMTASAILIAIEKLTGISCKIKWVNDIFLNKKKIAGILTETVRNPDNLKITHLIIGVGLNFAIQKFPSHLENIAGSLFDKTEPTISREELICEIWRCFNLYSKKDLIEYYKKNSLVLYKQVSFMQNQQITKGFVTGISDDGHLFVKKENGDCLTLSSGEISLLSW